MPAPPRAAGALVGPHDIDVVSWDVDGTLYRMPDVVAEVKRLIRRRMLSMRFIPAIWQLGRLQRHRKAMERVRERGGELLPGDLTVDLDLRLTLEAHWYGVAMERVGPWDGVTDLMGLFAARGLRQVVVSDYRYDYKLDALGLSGRFERGWAGEDLGFLKPSPELFRAAVRALGVPAHRVLHLGDRPETDGVAAAGAGCRVHIFDGGFSTPRELHSELTGSGAPTS